MLFIVPPKLLTICQVREYYLYPQMSVPLPYKLLVESLKSGKVQLTIGCRTVVEKFCIVWLVIVVVLQGFEI